MARPLSILLAAALAVFAFAAPAPRAETSAFADWAAVFVAGDWHAHSGAPAEVFDNARRDLAKGFEKAGFAPDNVATFSVRPERYPETKPFPSTPNAIRAEFSRLSGKAKGGCLAYFTSHGGPNGAGIILGERMYTPAGLSSLVDEACGTRPTVVVVSACFSGAFIPPLAKPNRMILTAARPDRASFGCGEEEVYTFFDTCMVQQLPAAADFLDLSTRVKACVAKREKDGDFEPASEPQTWVGPSLKAILPFFAFRKP